MALRKFIVVLASLGLGLTASAQEAVIDAPLDVGRAFTTSLGLPDSGDADCDGSGALDVFDFLCFGNLFNAGDPGADCDGSGTLDLFDYLCFQSAFAAGQDEPGVPASVATLTGLGFLPGGMESYGKAVSQDGSVVVGMCSPGPGDPLGPGNRAARWTETDGTWTVADLGMLENGYASTTFGVSADGSVVVGWTGYQTYSHACVWDDDINDGKPKDLETLGGLTSYAYGVNDLGSVVVGYSTTSLGYEHGFLWTPAGGMADVGTLKFGRYSRAYGVSGNGSVVVGSATSGPYWTAFSWKNGTMTNLGTLKTGKASEAWDANTDGTVIVGNSETVKGIRAFRWAGGKMTDLGTLPGLPNSYGQAVSGSGSVVVGYCGGAIGDPANRAFLWTSGGGMVDLKSYLTALGADTTDWTLYTARGISTGGVGTDGKTIVGSGLRDGKPEAWVAHLP